MLRGQLCCQQITSNTNTGATFCSICCSCCCSRWGGYLILLLLWLLLLLLVLLVLLSVFPKLTRAANGKWQLKQKICILSEFSSFVLVSTATLYACQLAKAIWPNCNLLLAVACWRRRIWCCLWTCRQSRVLGAIYGGFIEHFVWSQ